MRDLLKAFRNFFNNLFNLHEDKAEEGEIIQSIRRDVQFRGTNLWALIFAIMIASIGLNVNSTAVVIGAMLISPLMGPIMGIGLGVAINDFELLQKGIRNLAIAMIISILTSALYFSISPLHDVNSELLARTNPSLWDVFIAFFGGLAGIVAGTRSQKNNVMPGVAIATALMPPLCTAGFGLATGKWMYLLGALYLFFINSMLICLASFLIVKRLGFHKKEFQTEAIERRVTRSIWTIVIITILPSIYLAYRIVERSIFEKNAKSFISEQFKFSRTQVINRSYHMDGKSKTIEVLVVGQELSRGHILSLEKKLKDYGLANTQLIVHQGLNAKQEVDIAQIKASILEDVFQTESKNDTVSVPQPSVNPYNTDLRGELKTLFPDIIYYSLQPSIIIHTDTLTRDTVSLIAAKFRKAPTNTDKLKLTNWLKQRIGADSVKLVIE